MGDAGLAEMQPRRPSADLGGMDPGDFRAAKLAGNSADQRHALLYACERMLDSEERARSEATHDCGCDPRECERNIAEATALETQLERGFSTVDVGLGIAGRVGGSLAELIETEMRERVHCRDTAPAGVQIRRAAGLMWTLVALDAEVERELPPPAAIALETTRVSAQPAGSSPPSMGR